MGDCFGEIYLDLRQKSDEANMFCGTEDLRYASDGHLVWDNPKVFIYIQASNSHIVEKPNAFCFYFFCPVLFLYVLWPDNFGYSTKMWHGHRMSNRHENNEINTILHFQTQLTWHS